MRGCVRPRSQMRRAAEAQGRCDGDHDTTPHHDVNVRSSDRHDRATSAPRATSAALLFNGFNNIQWPSLPDHCDAPGKHWKKKTDCPGHWLQRAFPHGSHSDWPHPVAAPLWLNMQRRSLSLSRRKREAEAVGSGDGDGADTPREVADAAADDAAAPRSSPATAVDGAAVKTPQLDASSKRAKVTPTSDSATAAKPASISRFFSKLSAPATFTAAASTPQLRRSDSSVGGTGSSKPSNGAGAAARAWHCRFTNPVVVAAEVGV